MGIKSFEKRSKYPLIQYSAFTLGLKYDKIEYQLVEVKRMTVKINTKDGQIELTDEVIATVVGGAATEIFWCGRYG